MFDLQYNGNTMRKEPLSRWVHVSRKSTRGECEELLKEILKRFRSVFGRDRSPIKEPSHD